MSLIKMILKFAAPVPKIEAYDRFLFVGPHPDDIEIGAGATAAKLAAMGKKVCFLICTDGRFGDGHTALKGDELAAARKQEALSSAERLGVSDVRFLNLSDGGFYTADALRDGIAGVIGSFQPQVIFAPDPCVGSECHTDHLAAGETVRRLVCFAPNASIMAQWNAASAPVEALAYYMTAHPNQYIHTKNCLAKQLEAIFGCHLTQFPKGGKDAQNITLYLKIRSFLFGFRRFKSSAEGFRVLGQTQMHCLPEADE